MKHPKIGNNNEVTVFYPEKRVIMFKDMSTALSYELDAIPDDRDSYFTTRYLNVLQKEEVDDSAKWSVADRISALIQYGMQQNSKKLKVKFSYDTPCAYCGKRHDVTFNYASLFNNYKSPPKEWPVEKVGDREIKLKPMTGEFKTLIEFAESKRRNEKLNPHVEGTIEYENFKSEITEHNNKVFFEVEFLRVSAHTGVDVDELKEMPVDEFGEILDIVQKHIRDLNYGIQFWKEEEDQLKNPGLIEHYHKCPSPDEEYMEKKDPDFLKKFQEGGLEAILITLPFRVKYCING